MIKFIKILFLFSLALFASQADAQVNTTLSKKDTSDVRFLNSRKFYIYKVDKGETLFSISQKFNIPQEEILQFNKDIEGQGLKYKSKIWIPAYSWLNKEAPKSVPAEEEVNKHFEKNTYHITVLSHLNLPSLYIPDTLSDDSVAINEPIAKEMEANLQFTEGIMHAAEVMNKSGFKAVVRIIDTEDDTIKTLRQINKEPMPDLIITNATGPLLRWCGKFADDKNITLISAGINTAEQIRNYENVISMLPSSLTQCREMGQFMAENFPTANGIFIRTTQAKENERTTMFKLGWKALKAEKEIQIDYSKTGVKGIIDSLSKSKTNVIFIPTSNEDMVTTILSELKVNLADYKIIVVGLPTWQYFETLDQNLLAQCNTYIFSSGFIQDNSKEVEEFRKFFRESYNDEPGETAYQGYDAMSFSARELMHGGKKIKLSKSTALLSGLFTNYDFSAGMKENTLIHVFKSGDENVDLKSAKSKEEK